MQKKQVGTDAAGTRGTRPATSSNGSSLRLGLGEKSKKVSIPRYTSRGESEFGYSHHPISKNELKAALNSHLLKNGLQSNNFNAFGLQNQQSNKQTQPKLNILAGNPKKPIPEVQSFLLGCNLVNLLGMNPFHANNRSQYLLVG